MASADTSTGYHALVFGASGITGWAFVNAILNDYPDPATFSRVTALTNRHLTPETAHWPKSNKLNIVSGIDLLRGSQEELESTMKSLVPSVSTVTHVYFFAYIMSLDAETETQINVDLLRRAVLSIEHLSFSLKFVVLPTGTKAYGVHLLNDFPFKDRLPLKESLPRIPEPLFYYNQLDLLRELSNSKSWTFCDIIPDNINGFVPNNNIYCLAQALGLYLALYRHINGSKAGCVFPGTMKSWTNKFHDSSQDICANFGIWASLHPEITGGQSYNVADTFEPVTWEHKWPIICDYFNLLGVEPTNGLGRDPTAYVMEHHAEWLEVEKKYGLVGGRAGNERSFGGFPAFIMKMFEQDRQLDMSKMHQAWGSDKEEVDTKTAWWLAFDRFAKAKIIPERQAYG